MMKYIKSFSQGQITIPKDFRDALGLGKEFWMKVKLVNQKIVVEPVEKKTSKDEYLAKLRKLKGGWYDAEEYKQMRREMKKREKMYD